MTLLAAAAPRASHTRERGRSVVGGVATLAVLGLAGPVAAGYALHVQGLPVGQPALGWVAELTFVVTGVVVTLARPTNRVGWVILTGGVAMALGDAGVDLSVWGLVNNPGVVPGASALAITGTALRSVGWYTITLLLPTWFPTGHSLSGRWRLLPRLVLVTILLAILGTVFASHVQLDALSRWQNPLSSPAINAVADPVSGLSLLLGTLCLVAAVAQLVVRFRTSETVVRRQIGLYAAAAALPVVAAPLGVAGIAAGWIFYATTIPLPVCVGIAVLGRGLYDLPTAANKALVWATLSTAVLAIYIAVVGVVGSAVDGTGERWLPWVAGAAAAVSIAPLRDALQRMVNRVTYGRWEDPYQVLADLGQRLEASADVDRLLEEVTAELSSTLGLTDVAILDPSGHALTGRPTSGTTHVPLVAFGRPVGTLAYRSTRALRPADVGVLPDLAAHLGGLLHAHHLTNDLQRSRERLVLAREEERRRLRRDLHDGLGPALAGHLLRLDIASATLPTGSPVRAQLDDLRQDLQGTVEDVRRVVEGLRPPALDEIGLAAAVGQAVGRLTSTAPTAGHHATQGLTRGLRAHVAVGELPVLSAAVEVAAYRIATEAVTNVMRHADATLCSVTLTMDGPDLRLEVSDNGCGLTPGERHGHGLETMRERAEELGGTLSILTASAAGPPSGVTVIAILPAASTRTGS
jgi:signal transduction histidine kinase